MFVPGAVIHVLAYCMARVTANSHVRRQFEQEVQVLASTLAMSLVAVRLSTVVWKKQTLVYKMLPLAMTRSRRGRSLDHLILKRVKGHLPTAATLHPVRVLGRTAPLLQDVLAATAPWPGLLLGTRWSQIDGV